MASDVDAVLAVLEGAGFERLPKPLVVAGSTFDFDAAAKGTGVSHDLVLVAASPSAPRHLTRLLSGLSRTLDQVSSRRPVSLVLLGQTPGERTMTVLEQHARVLPIEIEAPDPEQIRKAIAVLMPLTLPSVTARGQGPLLEVTTRIGAALSSEHKALVNAALVGPDEVRDSLRRFIDGAVEAADSDEGER